MSRTELRLLALAAIGYILVTADVVVGGYLTHVDGQVRDAIQPRGESVPFWLGVPAELGDLDIAIPIVVISCIVCAQVLSRWWPVVLCVSAFAGTELVILAFKAAIGRDGPGSWADRENYPGYYPSGHTATTMIAVALVVFCVLQAFGPTRWRGDALPISLAAGAVLGAVAGTRAVLGDFHWASDVLGGLLLGYLLTFAALATARQHLAGRRHSPEAANHLP